MSTVQYPHIQISPDGVPMIAGTQTKVVEIVLERLAYNWDADEMHRQHSHLGLAQIHAALTYYYDHQDEIDRDIAERLARATELQARHQTPAVRLKLKGRGLLP